MKIVVITNLYPPFVRGGAEIVASRMAEGLRDALQHVSVITTRPYKNYRSIYYGEDVTINDVPVHRFYPFNLYYYLEDYRFPAAVRLLWHIWDMVNIHSFFHVRWILRKQKPDVVITHNLMGLGFLIPRLVAALGIRHVHIVHDIQLYNPSGIIMHGQEDTLSQRLCVMFGYPRLMNWLFAKTSLVISPSKFLLDFYTSRGFFSNLPTEVAPNPLIMPPEPLPHVMGDGKLRLAYLGQLSKPKGAVDLVRLMVENPDWNVELKLLGAGPALQEIADRVKNDSRVIMYGWRHRRDIETILQETDVLVVPTLCYDNSPTVVFEALGYGLPVIVSDVGGAKEIVTHGYNGWIFETGNWEQLGNIIQDIANHPEQILSAAQHTRNSVQHLDVGTYSSRMLDLIDTQK